MVGQGAGSLAKTMLEGTLDGKRSKGRREKSGITSNSDWTGMKVVDLINSARDRGVEDHCWAKRSCNPTR